MKKAAYFAYDQTSLAALAVLAPLFDQIDFFLVEPGGLKQTTDLSRVALMSDTLCIPSEQTLRTDVQKACLKTIAREFKFYRDQLTREFKSLQSAESGKGIDPEKACPFAISSLTAVIDVIFNSKAENVSIEIERVGITEYKQLFIENHQVVSDQFNRFSKNLFKKTPQNSHAWVSVEFTYELKKPREGLLQEKNFILIADRENNTVLDNWYFVHLKKDIISVQQWVPFDQFKNSDFQKFVGERVEKILKEKIDLIHLKSLNRFSVDATPGFSMRKTALKNPKLSRLMPSFNFWSSGMTLNSNQAPFANRREAPRD